MSNAAAAPSPYLADWLPDELPRVLGEQGIRLAPDQARRVYAAVVGRGESDLSRVKGVAHPTLRAVESALRWPLLEVKDRRASPTDGFVKYLFRLHDGLEVEAVRIPVPCEPPETAEGEKARAEIGGEWKGRRRKYVICVSSQAGCALGCTFCATATLGFKRNLAPWEIVAQVMTVRAEADRPIGGIVFMGMGEPFLNYDAVVRAAKIFSHPVGFGIGADYVTISTAGILPAIRRFTEEGHKFRLALSLSSARPERRRLLMPIERKYASREIAEALRAYSEKSGQRPTVAWVAIGGAEGNCTEEEAIALGELLRDVPVRLDLIDVNGEVGGFHPPDAEELRRFRDALSRHFRQPVVRRYSGGKDVDAACGMLAARSVERPAVLGALP